MKHLFHKYYHSTLKPGEFNKIADLFSGKENESALFAMMKNLWSKEMNDPEIAPKENPELFKRIKETISLDKQKLANKKIQMYSLMLRVAAVLVIALLSSTIFFATHTDSKLADQLQTITTPYGAKTKYKLPDGSIVWLNSGSKFSYPVAFGKARNVKLVGEAFFEVVKSKKPFIVSTHYGDVEVKGTSFNVNAYTDNNSFETTLVEGIVAFKVKGSTNGVTLKPGEQIVKAEKGFTIKNVETKYFTSWKEGKLIFNREPFPDFIRKLERWYNVKIIYSDPELDELWYTGTIEMESISEVMEMISKAAPVKYNFNEKTREFLIEAK